MFNGSLQLLKRKFNALSLSNDLEIHKGTCFVSLTTRVPTILRVDAQHFSGKQKVCPWVNSLRKTVYYLEVGSHVAQVQTS